MTDKVDIRTRHLSPGAFQLAELKRNIWHYSAPAGIDRSQLVEPTFYVHIAKKLRQFDRIEVQSVLGTFFAEVIVLAAKDGDVKLGELRYVDLDALAAKAEGINLTEAMPDGYRVEHREGKAWCIVRSADNEVLKDGCATMPAAKRWLTAHNKAMAA